MYGNIANRMDPEQLLRLIQTRLDELGISASQASTRAVGNHYLIRNMDRRKGWPSVENLQALCRVLGWEFYIGPPRSPSAQARDRREIEQALERTEESFQDLKLLIMDR